MTSWPAVCDTCRTKNEVIVKENRELRHILAHLVIAIEALCDGRPGSAMDDVGSIEGLIFYEDEAEIERLHRRPHGL